VWRDKETERNTLSFVPSSSHSSTVQLLRLGMNPGLLAAATLLALLAITFSFFNPQALFSPPHLPGSKDHLHAARILHVAGAVGPESLVFDAHGGGPYTGVADGRILKWEGEQQGWTDFAFTSSNRYTVFIIIYGCCYYHCSCYYLFPFYHAFCFLRPHVSVLLVRV